MGKPDRTEHMDSGKDSRRSPVKSDVPMELFAGEYNFPELLQKGPLVEIQKANMIHVVAELQKLNNREWRLLLAYIQPPPEPDFKKHEHYAFMLRMLKIAEGDVPDAARALKDLLEGTNDDDRKRIFRQFSILARMIGNGINVLDPQNSERGFPMDKEDDYLHVCMEGEVDGRIKKSGKLMFKKTTSGVQIIFKDQFVFLEEGKPMLLGRPIREDHLFGCDLQPPIDVHPALRIADIMFSGIGLIAVLRKGVLYLYDNMGLNKICFETAEGIGLYERVDNKNSDGRKDIGKCTWKAKEKPQPVVRSDLPSIIYEPKKPVVKNPPMPPQPSEQIVVINRLADELESQEAAPQASAVPKKSLIARVWGGLTGFFGRKNTE